jgi:Holliday junction resolvase RusA-like endonuclease
MKLLLKLMFLTLIVGLIAAVVASVVSKKKLESMSDDEIREYLGLKLAGRVGEDQLVTIQEAVVSGVRGKRPSVDNYVEDVEDAMDELDLVEEDAAAEEEALEAVVAATE